MREIIQIQVGQCGNQIGSQFWQTIAQQHKINKIGRIQLNNDNGLEYRDVFFNQTSKGNFCARGILTDLDSSSIDSIRGEAYARLFPFENMICNNGGTGNLFSRGFYDAGHQLIASVLEAVRRQVQASDYFQGFQLLHALGGGTGSGFASLLLNNLAIQYPTVIMQNYCILPSIQQCQNVFQVYNAMLSIENLTQCSTMCMMYDNDTLGKLCTKKSKIPQYRHRELNSVLVQTMAGLTCNMRFSGIINSSRRKLATNLIPFPRMHYLMTRHVPLYNKANDPYRQHSVSQLCHQLFHDDDIISKQQSDRSRRICTAAIFRGNVSSGEVEKYMVKQQQKNPRVLNWILNSTSVTYCNVPKKQVDLSATLIINSTAIRFKFEKMSEKFTTMFRKRSYVHHYLTYMDQMMFTQAQSHLNDLKSQFQCCVNNYQNQG